MPPASSGTVSWLIRVPGNGMKNSPISEASRRAALALSVSAPANSFRSSRPSRTLVSLGGLLRQWALRSELGQQRLAVGELGRVGDLPAGGHDVAEAARGIVDAAGLRCRRRWWRVGVGRRRWRCVGVGRWRWWCVGVGRRRWWCIGVGRRRWWCVGVGRRRWRCVRIGRRRCGSDRPAAGAGCPAVVVCRRG